MRRRIALRKHFVQNLPGYTWFISRSFRSAHASSRRFLDSRYAYAPMRRKMNVVSGLITSPFISSNG
jgi:beta-glucanase (GH16 family)